MNATTPGSSSPRTQQQRTARTRRALLDAAIECLLEYGYSGTTTALVCERAGLSRGAHLHQFGTRAALLAATIGRLREQMEELFEESVAELPDPGPGRTERALDVLWGLYSGPLFQVALELWTVGRSDPELLEALEPAGRAMNKRTKRLCQELFGDDARADEVTDLVLSTIRGLVILDIVQPGKNTSVAKRWPGVRARLLAAVA